MKILCADRTAPRKACASPPASLTDGDHVPHQYGQPPRSKKGEQYLQTTSDPTAGTIRARCGEHDGFAHGALLLKVMLSRLWSGAGDQLSFCSLLSMVLLNSTFGMGPCTAACATLEGIHALPCPQLPALGRKGADQAGLSPPAINTGCDGESRNIPGVALACPVLLLQARTLLTLSWPPARSLVLKETNPTAPARGNSHGKRGKPLPVFPEANGEDEEEERQQDSSGQERPHDSQECSREGRGALPTAVRRCLWEAKGVRRKKTLPGFPAKEVSTLA